MFKVKIEEVYNVTVGNFSTLQEAIDFTKETLKEIVTFEKGLWENPEDPTEEEKEAFNGTLSETWIYIENEDEDFVIEETEDALPDDEYPNCCYLSEKAKAECGWENIA